MSPRCLYYIPPRIAVDPNTDKVYEGAVMCEITGEYCVVEEGLECQDYNEFLKEEQDEVSVL